MAPVPVNLALSIVVGASMALAARRSLVGEPVWKTPALWALVAIEAILLLPIGAYLLWRHPDWSFMYLVEPGILGLPDAFWACAAPALAVGAFLAVRRSILASRLLVGTLVLAVGVALTSLVVFFGWQQLSVLGTTAAFRADPAGMRSIADSSLLFILPVATVVLCVSWGMTLWRLILLGHARRDQSVEVAVSPSKPSASRSGLKKAKKKADGGAVADTARGVRRGEP